MIDHPCEHHHSKNLRWPEYDELVDLAERKGWSVGLTKDLAEMIVCVGSKEFARRVMRRTTSGLPNFDVTARALRRLVADA